MWTYHVERDSEDNDLFFVVINDDREISGKSFDCANDAWKYAAKLVKQQAKRRGSVANYRPHFRGNFRGSWVVK